MMTVKELADKMHVSMRTIRYYDEIGILKPEARTEAGFRAYDEADEAKLKMILGFRELGFPLKEIEKILSLSSVERDKIIEKQIENLENKRKRIENRIALARGIQMLGSRSFQEIDLHDLDEQMDSARKFLDQNDDIQLFRAKTKDYTQEEWTTISDEMMQHFAAIGKAEEAHIQRYILEFAEFIDEYFFPCDDRILMNYAKMFGGDGVFGREVDAVGGEGTASRAYENILKYLDSK